MKNIRRLFIANRGEIARRVAISARKLGIQTVTLRAAGHTPGFLMDWIDVFIDVSMESSATYLDQDLMVRLALESGADALHPGFGFLSENAGFAKRVIDAGLTWVGPSSDAIDKMASKENARHIAEKAGLPVVPAVHDLAVSNDPKVLAKIATQAKAIGFPLIIKAAMGGGGKGMRLVHGEGELANALSQASSEALSSFGDGKVLMEKYLGEPRHVEVQVFGDDHGNVVTFGDRDCSVQRRHQKIIEEAPAPGLTPATRKAMHDAAKSLAKSVKYASAGTVEFLVDWSPHSRAKDRQDFYFLEMNTRLQVEHPVTEEVFGLDLVEWQLRVARGEKLLDSFQTLEPRGHSIEVRLYAEDCRNKFFPSPGEVKGFLPAELPGVRWEVGLDSVDEVSGAFDPMVAKIVTKGRDRHEAMDRMVMALDRTLLVGPHHNLGLLRTVFLDQAFRDAPVTTHYLRDDWSRLEKAWDAHDASRAPVVQAIMTSLAKDGVPSTQSGNGLKARTASVFGKTTANTVDCATLFTQDVFVTGRRRGAVTRLGRGMIKTAEGRWQNFSFVDARDPTARETWVSVDQVTSCRREARGEALQAGRAHQAAGDIVAPVPGKVKKILVRAGENVTKHQTVLVLESMKMEFEVQAPKAGTVGSLKVEEGTQVNADDLLIAWSEETQLSQS